jgi:hypothetical protein
MRRSTLKSLRAAAAAAVLGVFAASSAFGGSVSSSDTWAPDYTGLALPAGTLLVIDYVGYSGNNDFIDTNGNKLGGHADIWSNVARVSYFTRLGGMPLVLEAALPYAQVNNADIGGVPQTTHGGFFSPVLFETLGLIVNPKQQRYLGLTSYEYLPLGDYSKTSAINVATPDQFVWVPQIGYSEGLTKFGAKNFWLDFIANASIHSRGSDPFSESTLVPSLIGPLPASIAYKRLDQADSYNLKGFVRYDYMPLGHVAVGIEKSWGGLQTLADGSVTTAFGSQALANMDISKDDYLRGHLQLTMPLAKDFQVGADLHHDFERVGGYKEDFGAEVRFIKFFIPAAPAASLK